MSDAATAAPAGDNGSTSAALAPSASATPSHTIAPPPNGAAPDVTTTTAPAATPAGAVGWLDGADELTLGYAQNKGWQNPLEAVKSYQNLEKLLGADRAGRTVVLPGENATPEEKAAFYEKLGRPASPADYGIKPGEGGDPKALEPFLNKFHELGLSKAQAEELTKFTGELAKQQQTQTAAQKATAFQADDQSLRTEWGAAYDQNVMAARASVQALGLDSATIDKISDALGHKATMELFAKIGSKTGESDFVTGDPGNFRGAMTPAQAKAQIKELQSDREFVKQYTSGNADARAKMAQLHQWAYSE